MSVCEVEDEWRKTKNESKNRFFEWIPHSVKTAVCKIPLKDKKLSAVCLANTTAMHDSFLKLSEQFCELKKRKAFLPWYTGEGMDEQELFEAISNLNDLQTEYLWLGREHDQIESEESLNEDEYLLGFR